MRFGKKLALAMIRDAGEAPYLSQKNLKHTLVGLEKLCKLYSEQLVLLSDSNHSNIELISYINSERVKVGVPAQDRIMEISEALAKDEEFFSVLRSDVEQLRRYVEGCEADLMEAINEWLEASASERLVEESHLSSTEASTCRSPEDDLTTEAAAVKILDEFSRIRQYVGVNTSAINKLMARRNKNVPECFWSVEEFPEIGSISTEDSRELAAMAELIGKLRQHSVVDSAISSISITPTVSFQSTR